MRTLISLTLGTSAALIASAIEDNLIGQPTGWLGMFWGFGVYLMVFHILQMQRRYH